MTAVPQDGVQLDPRRWRALAVCVTALFTTLLDVSIVAVALPSIGRDTGADPAQLQWVVSGYALAFGMVPIIGGRLGDDRGRKRMLLIGIGSFAVCSTVVGLAPTAGILVAGRVLQGLAGGLVNPQVSGVVQQLFPLDERGRAFGVIGTVVGVATAAGPVVGGSIIALGGPTLGWRLCSSSTCRSASRRSCCAAPGCRRGRARAPCADSTCPVSRCWASASWGCCSPRCSTTPAATLAWRCSWCRRFSCSRRSSPGRAGRPAGAVIR